MDLNPMAPATRQLSDQEVLLEQGTKFECHDKTST